MVKCAQLSEIEKEKERRRLWLYNKKQANSGWAMFGFCLIYYGLRTNANGCLITIYMVVCGEELVCVSARRKGTKGFAFGALKQSISSFQICVYHFKAYALFVSLSFFIQT